MAGSSIPAAISAGYTKALRTIIDANVVTIGVAFILFTLATAGRQGIRVHAGCRHARVAVHRRARHLGDPRLARAHAAAPAAERARRRPRSESEGWQLRLHGQLALVLLVLGRDPGGRRARDRHARDQLRHRLRVRHADHRAAAAERRAWTRCATRSPRSDTRTRRSRACNDPELGNNVVQIEVRRARARTRSTKVEDALDDDFGVASGRLLRRARSGRPSASRSRARR